MTDSYTRKSMERLLKQIIHLAVDPWRGSDYALVVVDSLDSHKLPQGQEYLWFRFGLHTGSIAMSAQYCSPALKSLLRDKYNKRQNEHEAIGKWSQPNIISFTTELEKYIFPALETHLALPLEQRIPDTPLPIFPYTRDLDQLAFRWNGLHANDMFIDAPGKYERSSLLDVALWEQEGEDEILYENMFDGDGYVYRMFRITEEQRQAYNTTSEIVVLWEDESGFLCESSWDSNGSHALPAEAKYQAFKAEIEGTDEEEESVEE